MQGAVSQMDTWEYKPVLQASDNKTASGGGTLTASKFKFAQHGETGTWLSELLPHTARHVDKLCFLRGLHTDTPAHPQAVIQLHTGTALASLTRPSLGAWLLYGLGSENEDLPGYITINPPPTFGGAVNYGSAFLPAYYQGMRINDKGYVPNLQAKAPLELQRKQLDLLQAMNHDLAVSPGSPDELDGVIASYELAFKMQDKVPALLDYTQESPAVLEAYGMTPGPAGSFARQCLMARRLSEAGVRFVEICHPGWDQHRDLHRGLVRNTAATDQPTAALLADLEQRGLLDETLVVFGSEFGRLPTAQGPDGRDHNITGYSSGWPARASNPDFPSAPPTRWACTPCKDACTRMTFTRPCLRSWAWTTRCSPTDTRGGIFVSPTLPAPCAGTSSLSADSHDHPDVQHALFELSLMTKSLSAPSVSRPARACSSTLERPPSRSAANASGGVGTQHEYQIDYAAWLVADLGDPVTPAPLPIASSATAGPWTQALTFGAGFPNLQSGDVLLLQQLLIVDVGDFPIQNWRQEVLSPDWQWVDGSIFDGDTRCINVGLAGAGVRIKKHFDLLAHVDSSGR
jgi:hypothetical protein